jgi:NAD(P)-dependent dehydrogenase (short-subunit alcohol dehydrogenase family)
MAWRQLKAVVSAGRPSPLAGRTVLVTGPARGIGRETARQAVARGAGVALVGLEPDPLRSLASALGPSAAWFEADVRDRASVERAVAGAVGRFGRLDAVVANAGIARVGLVESIDPAEFEDTIDVNLLGVWRTVRAALPHLLEHGGYVLCVASMAAAIHLPLMAPYAAAKAGVSAFADSLRMELAGRGVAVGVAYFGFIDTDMVRASNDHPAAQAARRRAPRLFAPRPLPVDAAGRAIVEAIERRSRWTFLPRGARAAFLWAPRFQRLAESQARRLGIDDLLA